MQSFPKGVARAFTAATVMMLGAAGAQQPGRGEEPKQTTAAYGDWVVICETRDGPPPQKVCTMAQGTQVRGKNVPFSRLMVAHPAKGQPIKLFAQLPVNVSLLTDVRIQTSESDTGVAAPFARCVQIGCIANFDIKDDILKKLRDAPGAGRLSFADAAGHAVVVPVSFKGFSEAFDALSKE